MSLFRVPLQKIRTTYGYINIEAEDVDDAIDKALHMDAWDIEDDESSEWGSCGDHTEIAVLYEDDVEDITPPSVNAILWD